jgi:hypothetical protein
VIENLTDLRIFARIVAAGSLSQAGRELKLSLAVVSLRPSKSGWASTPCRRALAIASQPKSKLHPRQHYHDGARFCLQVINSRRQNCI